MEQTLGSQGNCGAVEPLAGAVTLSPGHLVSLVLGAALAGALLRRW